MPKRPEHFGCFWFRDHRHMLASIYIFIFCVSPFRLFLFNRNYQFEFSFTSLFLDNSYSTKAKKNIS